jgi:ArsR family transcriptional regulator
MFDTVQLFKALADGTRLRIAGILAINGETCVCRLAEALEEPDAKISRHLAIMRSAELVSARREGTWMHYRLIDENQMISCLRDCLRSNLAEAGFVKDDLARLTNEPCATR